MTTNRNWYLVYSKAQQEERAVTNLERQGYPAFLPRLRVQVRSNGRFATRIVPMFPRYLFIQLDPENEPSTPIRSTFGVSTLIRSGPTPAIVPSDLVEGLIAAADETGIVKSLVPSRAEPGQRVRVIDGLLQGYEGIVQARNGGERVRVLLDVVNTHTTATLNAHHITVVPD